ncbi:DUF4381 domain-containing protein [Candidatus Marimicrobium litorale]|uniref:DUF4381 domain-containing protein n=1 Tax=Candidatus Marimicrobium litorale TaxID=2518991 RepID=A0ABT3T9C5_9GAMM|nr:DUF4381 domain-containing protein [Candidatus Marimicrobium litorale]MCX2978406.1 DUF4381 domain-containing protein [Candidatus Marimicrobium litorale]
MSAPPLPDIFGNYILGDFVEVVSPVSVSWLPQTAGWACLGALLGGLFLFRGAKRLRRWHHNRYRREAIDRLVHTTDQSFSIVALNKLLKLTALSAFPREQVARLSGEEWVSFLNRQCESSPFSPALGKIIADGAYRQSQLTHSTREELVAAALSWIRDHKSPHDV